MPENRSKRGGARPGAGRPRKYDGGTEIVSFAAPPGLAKQIDERVAAGEASSRSEWLVVAIEQAIRRRDARKRRGST